MSVYDKLTIQFNDFNWILPKRSPPLHEVLLWLHSYVLISARMFTYEADERDTKELSKVEYFISFCLVSYVRVVRVCSVHYSFTVIELKENDSYLYLMSIFCYLDRFKTPTKFEILFLYSNIFTVFPKKEYMPEEYKSLLGYDKYSTSLPGLHWRWKPQAPPKSWYMHPNLHGVVTKETGFNNSTAVITSKIAQNSQPPNTRNPQIFQNLSKYRSQKMKVSYWRLIKIKGQLRKIWSAGSWRGAGSRCIPA